MSAGPVPLTGRTSMSARPVPSAGRPMSLDMRPRRPASPTSTSPTARSTWRASRMTSCSARSSCSPRVLTVLLSRLAAPARHLDPADSSLSGSMALAELLRDRGVTVDRVDSVGARPPRRRTVPRRATGCC